MKIFKYIDKLDCFIVNPDYKEIANKLGLNEWNEVVWIGRYFSLDNDNGEHWFDNWELRDKLKSKAAALGIDYDDLLVIEPERLKNDFDGPVHTGDERKRFWTDVLKSLELSFDTIFSEAIKLNNELDKEDEEYIVDLEIRINEIKKRLPITAP